MPADPGSIIVDMPKKNPEKARAWQTARSRMADQGGTISAQQAMAAGLGRDDIRRAVDAGVLLRAYPGVYVQRPRAGELAARMWAAHLAAGPASVVGGIAAAQYWGLADEDEPQPVVMVVAESAHRVASGLRTRRVPDPISRAHPARIPPVLSVEETVLAMVGLAPDDASAAEVIMRACRLRLTTPPRILSVAAGRARIRRRGVVKAVCAEVQLGITSPLERVYRRRVATPHGLPRALGQARELGAGGAVYRDLLYEAHGVIVELDGRRGHEDELAGFRDQRRDNHATLTGRASLRYGWIAILRSPCDVAAEVSGLLMRRGWEGTPRACGPRCAVGLRLAG